MLFIFELQNSVPAAPAQLQTQNSRKYLRKLVEKKEKEEKKKKAKKGKAYK